MFNSTQHGIFVSIVFSHPDASPSMDLDPSESVELDCGNMHTIACID